MNRRLAIGVLVLAAVPALAAAQGVTCGDFLVNSTTSGRQGYPTVVSAPNGDFMVAWESSSITGRRFNAAGTPQGPEFVISTAPGSDPSAALDAAGNVVMVWHNSSGVLARRLDATGAPLGPELLVSPTGAFQRSDVAVDPAGNFFVVWAEGGSPHRVIGRRYDSSGVAQGPAFPLDPDTTFSQTKPSIAFQGGAFAVVWRDDGPINYRVIGRRFDVSGAPLGASFTVTDLSGYQANPRVARGPADDFLVVWERRLPGGGIMGRAYDQAANPRGPEFLINASTTDSVDVPAIAGDPDHGFVVVFHNYSGGSDNIRGRRLDLLGVPVGSEFAVNREAPPSFNWQPSVARGLDGGYVAVWQSNQPDGLDYDVFGHLDCATRFYPVPPCRLADTRSPPAAPLLANTTRLFPATGACGIPADARALALNVTAVNPTDVGNLRVYPGGATAPLASTVNFVPGRTRANNAIVATGGQLAVQCDMPAGSTGSADLLLDVYGYFKR